MKKSLLLAVGLTLILTSSAYAKGLVNSGCEIDNIHLKQWLANRTHLSGTFDFVEVWIEKIGGECYLKIPLPKANTEWTLTAYTRAICFITEFHKDSHIQHDVMKTKEDGEYIFIKLYQIKDECSVAGINISEPLWAGKDCQCWCPAKTKFITCGCK